MEKYINIIVVFGLVINAIIIWLLAQKDKIELSQKILIVFFVVIIFLLTSLLAELNDFLILFILTFNISDAISLIIGPLILLYVRSLFIENKGLVKKNLVHFIYPVFYILVITLPMLILNVLDIKVLIYEQIEFFLDNNVFIATIYENIILFAYTCFSFKLFFKYIKATKFVYSNIEETNFNWIKYLLYGIFIINIYDAISIIFSSFYEDYTSESFFTVVVLLVLFLYYLGYKGVNHSKILVPDFLLQPLKKQKTKVVLKIDEKESEIEIQKIIDIILEKSLFIDKNLSLSKLAKETNLTDKKLSTIINQQMKTTFYDLINTYRLAEFKRRILLEKYENITILGVAYDCGFKSKSTFNRLFKLHNGISPSVYKKENIKKSL